jgi:methyltransferase (TIGR00027 family)
VNPKKIMLDCHIFLCYKGKQGIEYKEAAEKFIQAISVSQLEASVLQEDLQSCLVFLNEEEFDELLSLFERLKISCFSCKKKLSNEFFSNFNVQMSSLKLNDSRNQHILAAFSAFNQTSTFSKKFDALVTFNPQDYYLADQNSKIRSVIDILDDFPGDLSSKQEKLKRQMTKEMKVPFCPARINAAMRGLENFRSDRLFEDNLSWLLAGTEAHSIIQTMNRSEERPYVVVRTRYIDDLIKSSSNQIKQIIIIGAGMDTRAFRLSYSSDTVIFEVEQQDLLEEKQRLLDKVLVTPNCPRFTIPADLTQRDWIKFLITHKNYDNSKPSFIIMEGVQMYLHEEQLHNLLKDINCSTAYGSLLFMDIINKRALLNSQESWGWKSGFDFPEQLFTKIGWKPEIKQPGDQDASYGRYTCKPSSSDKKLNIERVFLCTAQKNPNFVIENLQNTLKVEANIENG